jgi:hypothetical protein
MQRLLHVEDNFDQIIISNKISKVVVGGMLKSTTNIIFSNDFVAINRSVHNVIT